MISSWGKSQLAEVLALSRAALEALVEDSALFFEEAAWKTERTFSRSVRKNTVRVWLPSFVTLGAVDVAFSSTRIARAAKGLSVVGAVGGVGLIVSSTVDMMRASSAEEVLDATGDLAWGIQGLSYVTASSVTANLTAGMGFIGAVVQMSAGMLRIAHGIRVRDDELVKLGSLDLGGGVLWAALDVAAWGNPIVLGGYVVLMVGREAYANKDAILRWLRPRPPLLLPPARLAAIA